jgi:hypothetical protein
MSWNEVFQTIAGVFVSTGVAGGIIWKISSYLGEIWAKKYLESIKKEYQKEIEAYKAQIDLLRETALRYSGRQFELYTKLWHSLYDLKTAADMLWEKASPLNLRKFSRQLKKTTDEVEKSYLFIEESHYRELKNLLKQFCDYQFGKSWRPGFRKYPLSVLLCLIWGGLLLLQISSGPRRVPLSEDKEEQHSLFSPSSLL